MGLRLRPTAPAPATRRHRGGRRTRHVLTRPDAGARRRSAVGGLCLAACLIPLNSTMIVVALLDVGRDLDVDVGAVFWLVSGYLVAVALSQPLGGRFGDAHGHRRVFGFGLVGFVIASALASLAPSFPALVAARMAQAVCAGLIWPTASAMLRDVATPGRRGRLFGWFGTAVGLAAAAGPVIGGGLVALGGWRAIFLVNIPVGAGALALSAWAAHAATPRPARVRGPFDWAGALVFTALIGAVVTALSFATDGVARWLGALVAAAALMAVFIAVERRAADPFVTLSLFADRAYVGATTTVLLHNAVMYSLLLVVPVYAERTLGLGASGGGLLIGSMTAAMMMLSPIGGHLNDRAGARLPALAGGGAAVLATAGLVVAGPPAVAGTAALVAVAGAGIGLASAPLQTTAVDSAGDDGAGVAAGVFTTMRYTGGIAAAGLAATVTSSGQFRAGFLVLAAGAALSLVAASALPARPGRPEALTTA